MVIGAGLLCLSTQRQLAIECLEQLDLLPFFSQDKAATSDFDRRLIELAQSRPEARPIRRFVPVREHDVDEIRDASVRCSWRRRTRNDALGGVNDDLVLRRCQRARLSERVRTLPNILELRRAQSLYKRECGNGGKSSDRVTARRHGGLPSSPTRFSMARYRGSVRIASRRGCTRSRTNPGERSSIAISSQRNASSTSPRLACSTAIPHDETTPFARPWVSSARMRLASRSLPRAASTCARPNDGPAMPPDRRRPSSYSARASSSWPSASSERARPVCVPSKRGSSSSAIRY